MHTAKRLAYYKINYPRLDSLVVAQQKLISFLDQSMAQKRKLLELCYQTTDEQQKQIALLKAREQKAIQKAEVMAKTPFLVKIKFISIGVGIASVGYLLLK